MAVARRRRQTASREHKYFFEHPSLTVTVTVTVTVTATATFVFELKCGLKQGSVLSPLLFNIYLGAIMEEACARHRWGEDPTLLGVTLVHDPGALRYPAHGLVVPVLSAMHWRVPGRVVVPRSTHTRR